MPDYQFGGWSRYGFAAKAAMSLTTSYQGLALGEDAAVKRSKGAPDDSHLYDILFEFTTLPTGAGSPSQVSFYLARDAAGTQPLTPVMTATITRALGSAAATKGGAYAKVEADFHAIPGVGPDQYNDLYLVVKLDAGTATANAYQSWRS